MAEMGLADCQFTWRGPTSQSRLDRFLCSPELLAAFPLAEVSALHRPLSDHTPICWSSMVGSPKPIYFQLNRSLFRDEKLKRDILAWWCSHLCFGTASDKLATKLKDLRHHFFELRQQIRTARTQARETALARVQELDAVEDMRRLMFVEEKEWKKSRDVVAEADLGIELDWRQRSRQLWLLAGDANTRFFHMAAIGRHRQNCIWHILVGDRAFTDQSSIGLALADYFREFYHRGPPNRWRWLANGAATLSSDQQQELISPVTEEEVLVAIRRLNSEGATGLDGIPVFFYLDCRDVVGPEVLATIEEFQAGRCNMDRLNRAYIILLPQVEGAERIGDFQPILLSNSIYLIIAKVLANRLRTALPALISPFQLAFMPGRQMADNIVLVEEIVASWRRDGMPGFLWKVDFSKAYDSLDWLFLWNVLRRRGFLETWIRWVKQCVTTPTFCCSCEWAPTRRMDPPSARHSTGLSIGPTPIYSCCRLSGCVHIAAVSQWRLCRVLVFQHPWRYPASSICG